MKPSPKNNPVGFHFSGLLLHKNLTYDYVSSYIAHLTLPLNVAYELVLAL